MFRHSFARLGILAACAVPSFALAQDWQLPPTYGQVELSTGFGAAHTVELQAGGAIDASALGGGCIGLVAEAPDFDLYFDAGTAPLEIFVTSDADTTLVINAPDGSWVCNDDTNGLDPAVVFDAPLSGLYDIWVGSFSGFPDAVLHIAEGAGAAPVDAGEADADAEAPAASK